MITSSQVSSMYCKNQWVFAPLERMEGARIVQTQCLCHLYSVASQWAVLSGNFALGISAAVSKGFLTIWCYIQLIQKTKNIAGDTEICDCWSLWLRFPSWHIKITLLHQKKSPRQKARKAGSSLFIGSKMMCDFQFYVVQLFLHCIFSNVIGVLDMWSVYLMIYATVLA